MAMIQIDIAEVLFPVSDPVEIPDFQAFPAGIYLTDETGAVLTDESGGLWSWE